MAKMAVFTVLLIALDQWTKAIAIGELMGSPTLSYLHGFLSLTYQENNGAFLGLGASLSETVRLILFSGIISIFLLAGFIYLCVKPHERLTMTVGLLFIAGGTGNLIDRVTNDGAVIDFAQLHLAGLHTGVFNVADMYFMLGVFLALIAVFSTQKNKQER